MYLMTGTRPDLAHLLQLLSQFLTSPTKAHMAAAKHGLRYLAGTIQQGLRLGLGGDYEPTDQLHAYADSDYVNCVDTRRCVAG